VFNDLREQTLETRKAEERATQADQDLAEARKALEKVRERIEPYVGTPVTQARQLIDAALKGETGNG
jgi:hypothetical protein